MVTLFPSFMDNSEPVTEWHDNPTHICDLPDLITISQHSTKIYTIDSNSQSCQYPLFFYGTDSDPVIKFISKLIEHYIKHRDLQQALSKIGYHAHQLTTNATS